MTRSTKDYNSALSMVGAILPVTTSPGGQFIDNNHNLVHTLLGIQSSKVRVTFHPVSSHPETKELATRPSVESVTYDASEG